MSLKSAFPHPQDGVKTDEREGIDESRKSHGKVAFELSHSPGC